ncbi:13630_t:CDS:2, partial [Funneliformis mosseae]
ITIFASILHSLHGLPTTDVFSISIKNKKYGTGPLFDLPSIPNVPIDDDNESINLEDFGWKLGAIVMLVLLGGIFAGLTIGLMGLDETNLQVLMVAGEHNERRHAKKVLDLLQKGKHWVLVTLLLSNVIVNETLPIIFDSVFGGGWPAVLISTALIVMFGEIIPQVAYPIAGILDFCLGEQHGTMYRKSGIESLNEDEVQIIGAVLDLREKPVSAIMTPLEDVFTLSADKVLNEQTVDEILSRGYSRIPVYEPPNPTNFIGMLLVKKLITYDPEDAWSVRDFQLSSLPETNPYTSCLDILKFFQEGRSHMALVSEDPGGNEGGALGVVTLEDVIEELIGEEIIDETDVYVDVRNKIKVVRLPPRQIRPRLYYSFLSKRSNHDEIEERPESTKPLINTNYKSTDDDHELVGFTNGIHTNKKEP